MTNKEAVEHLKIILSKSRSNKLHIITQGEEIALGLAIKALEDVEEWDKLKLICANEGIIVYKVKENNNADSN